MESKAVMPSEESCWNGLLAVYLRQHNKMGPLALLGGAARLIYRAGSLQLEAV
jgi:hypothetical protein